MVDVAALVQELAESRRSLEKANQLLDQYREAVRLLYARLYGRRSERQVSSVPGLEQLLLLLFDAGDVPAPVPPHSPVDVPAHTRRPHGRQPLPPELPRVEVLHDVPEADRRCACGVVKERIGEEVSEQISITPAQAHVLRHVRPKYACQACQGVPEPDSAPVPEPDSALAVTGRQGVEEAGQDEGASTPPGDPPVQQPTVSIAPPPSLMIPKSIASNELLAYIATSKYVDALPLYRQQAMFRRMGISIGRHTMAGWMIKVGDALLPFMELLRQEILGGPLINCDETPLQVLKEPGRPATTKSYLWVFRGGDPAKPAVVFVYHPTRSGDVPRRYLCGYCGGRVQTDDYVGYDFLDGWPGVIHVGCLAHIRRKFVDVMKAAGGTGAGGLADEAVQRIRDLYLIERLAEQQGLRGDALVTFRQEQARPRFEAMHAWLLERAPEVPPRSLLGKAISYALNQLPRVEPYLSDAQLRPDNNLVENAIRPFAVGRKNWLFSDVPEGAEASARIYTMVETARANALNPHAYLRALFDRLPRARTTLDYKALLPQHIDRTLLHS